MLEFLTLTFARAKFHSIRSDSPIVRGLVIQKARAPWELLSYSGSGENDER